MTEADHSIQTFTATDGYAFRYRHFPAHGTPRGRVVYIHGIQSHGGWYVESSRHLARAGHEVFFLDRRGSGLNDQARGDCPSFRRLLADIAEFIQSKPGPAPVVAGISWGGKLAVALELFHPGLTAGLVLIAPGIRAKVGPSLWTRLRIGFNWLFFPWRLFPIPLDDPALFTDNPERQEYIRTDPLSLRLATARFLVESVRLDWALGSAPPRVRVPILLLLAEHDRIIHNADTRDYVGSFATPDWTIIEYPGTHHTLEFEPGPMRFCDDMVTWLSRRTG
jgi:alpha-beta hydrolase superfamily lysophospholipase